MRRILYCMALALCACSSVEETQKEKLYAQNEWAESIARMSTDIECPFLPVTIEERPLYPWETKVEEVRPITKEDFRCRGCATHQPHSVVKQGKEAFVYTDCGGGEEA